MSYKIEKQPNGLYKIRVWGTENEFGKIPTKQVSNINSKAVARDKAITIEEELNNISNTSKDYTFKELNELYHQAMDKNLSPNTKNSNKSRRETTLKYWGNVKANCINTKNVQEWINKLEQQENPHKKGTCLKKASVQEYVKILKTTINWAVDNELLDYSRIKKLTYKEDEEEFEPTILTPQQLKEILIAIKQKCYNIYIPTLVSLYADPRRGEILALTYNDINFEQGYIPLKKTAYEEDGEIKIKNKLKSKTSKRIVALSDFVKQEILEHKKLNCAKDTDKICDNIFIGELRPRYVSRNFHEFVKSEFGIDMRFHDLRHNFNQMCFENGIDLSTRSQLLGHSNEKITNTIYTHYSPKKAKEAVEKVSASIGLQNVNV